MASPMPFSHFLLAKTVRQMLFLAYTGRILCIFSIVSLNRLPGKAIFFLALGAQVNRRLWNQYIKMPFAAQRAP